MSSAREVKAAGATGLRGGAFKPRTSPYSFQGMKEDGLKLLAAAREDAYATIAEINLDGSFYRTDIALPAVEGRITL